MLANMYMYKYIHVLVSVLVSALGVFMILVSAVSVKSGIGGLLYEMHLHDNQA